MSDKPRPSVKKKAAQRDAARKAGRERGRTKGAPDARSETQTAQEAEAAAAEGAWAEAAATDGKRGEAAAADDARAEAAAADDARAEAAARKGGKPATGADAQSGRRPRVATTVRGERRPKVGTTARDERRAERKTGDGAQDGSRTGTATDAGAQGGEGAGGANRNPGGMPAYEKPRVRYDYGQDAGKARPSVHRQQHEAAGSRHAATHGKDGDRRPDPNMAVKRSVARTYQPKSRAHTFTRVLGALLTIVVLFFVVSLGYLTITAYRPSSNENVDLSALTGAEATGTLEIASQDEEDETEESAETDDAEGESEASEDAASESATAASTQISLITWNLGSCIFSDEADYFMEGGSGTRGDSSESVQSNLEAVESLLLEQDADIVLLQEVDVDSKRSYGIDESAGISDALASSGYCSLFVTDRRSAYVPYPLGHALGRVNSGLQTESKLEVASAKRMTLETLESWPASIFAQKQNLLVERYDIEDSTKQLVVINLDLVQYDENGETRTAQTEELIYLMQVEYSKGNYVIAGGDFSQTFGNLDTSAYPQTSEDLWEPGVISASSLGEDLTATADASTPTQRSLSSAYSGGDGFQYYVVDGFIVSANVQIDSVETIDTGFAYSNHNPVSMTVTLI